MERDQWTLTVVVISFIECHVEGLHRYSMVIAAEIEGSANDEASHDEREGNMVVLLISVGGRGLARKPEIVVFAGGGNELLLNGRTIGTVFKDLKSVQAAPQSRVAIEPLMMDSTQLTIAAVDLSNHEQLVSLAHLAWWMCTVELCVEKQAAGSKKSGRWGKGFVA